VTVEINMLLAKSTGINAEPIVEAAVAEAHKVTETFLRKLK
jgi:hypothetical protein